MQFVYHRMERQQQYLEKNLKIDLNRSQGKYVKKKKKLHTENTELNK